MKKVLIGVMLLISAEVIFAENVNSPIDGTIIYLPKNNEIAKKGDILIQFDSSIIECLIKKTILELQLAKERYKDSCSDLKRMKMLSRVLSKASQEDITIDYHVSKTNLEKLKIYLQELTLTKLHQYTIKAPFDCKIRNCFLIPNSGVKKGTEILEVEKVN